MAAPTLTIVIPVLNEAGSLEMSLRNGLAIADEVVVSDGGSSDASMEIAGHLGARVVKGAAGRGAQLNRGAAEASGDVLLFLHADSLLAEGARSQIEGAVADGYCGGGLLLRFDVAGPLLRFGAGWINARTRLTRLPLGDQGQFATREAFAALGGFSEWPVLEDLDLMRRLKSHGRVAILEGPITTSSRRFRSGGILKTLAINWTIWLLYLLGVSPLRLGRWYRNIR